MANVQKEVYVEGLGQIYVCNDSAFDDESEAVLGKSDSLITLRDLAYARIHEGKDSSVSKNGSYVQEGSLFVPKSDNKRIWLRDSLVLQNPASAVKAHKKNNEYQLPQGFDVNAHLASIGKDNYLVLKDISSVPTNRFGEDPRMVWAFGDQSKAYGDFLSGAGIKNLNIWMYTDDDNYIDSQKGPFANQLWLLRLDDYSLIGGSGRDLDDYDRVRGVRAVQKNSDLYSLNQITDTFKTMKLEGLTESYIKELKKDR